ncbi:MAG: family 20 glycosylhydrolase [Eubacteriales bacterium]|nr:family 20 glycosylhydrolase [Eubacteriales bacterium]
MKKIISALLSAVILLTGSAVISAGADEVNAPPTVIPAVREWEGKTGKFYLKKGMKVTLESEALVTEAQKTIIKDYFLDIAGIDLTVTEGINETGDIYLKSSSDTALGDEGYTIDAGDSVTIEANTGKGLLYGIITVLQSCYADGYMPKGRVRDWPSYPVRSGMIDVARAYIPLDYVEEITKYFAWYKLNEIHLHINDNGANGYNIFRLESDISGLTATDGYYSKEDYRAYQKRMLEYGVEVITEIDTPAHCRCFADVVPGYMLSDGAHLDITNPDAVQFVLDLFDEYITGDDPVFVSKKVHFGTDEYPEGYNEAMRAYTNTLIEHIRSRGYTPRFWGAFGAGGFNGSTPVSGDAEVNFWADSLSDYKTLFSMGYDVINSCSYRLYCVPGGNYGFADYFDLKLLYNSWFVNYMGYDSNTAVAYDNPQLKGASFCLWNDRHTEWGGFSMFDIFDRVRYQVCYVSEKAWDGEQTRNIDADDFISRFETLSRRAGNTDPSRFVSLPLTTQDVGSVKSVGFPYLFSADIKLSGYSDAVILSGEDGKLFVNAAGKISFSRETYTFNYNYTVPLDTSVNIKLYADNAQTVLIVDDTYYYDPVNIKNPSLADSSTFVLPFESSGSASCEVTDIGVTAPDYNLNDKKLNINMALGKTVTVSGLEVDYALNEPLAVDGNHDTRLSFARDKDEQWMLLDLGTERNVNKIVIDFHECVSAYEIYVSSDGENFTKVYEISGKADGVHVIDTVEIDSVICRYIKYVQLKRWYCAPYSTYYSGGIREFEVYGMDTAKYELLLGEAEELIDTGTASDTSGIRIAANALEKYLKEDIIYGTHIDGLYDTLKNAMDEYKNPSSEESDIESADESTASDLSEEVDPTPDKPGFPWLIAIVCAVAITAAAFVILKIKKVI